MPDEELEQVRKKKALEMQKKQELEAKMKAALRVALEDAAYERMMNVRVSNPELFLLAAQECLRLYPRLGRQLADSEALLVLRRMKGEERKGSIKIERK